ncbi:hypothetical protein KY363_02170 [Candidatus Woesearchaeota archaeon]|nr:hypothetical protein [Candidatus Woesearchaeota archaeon]
MTKRLEGSELEKALNIQRMYEEFDDCRHLVEDVFDYGRQNRVRSYHMETALDLAYGDYLGRVARSRNRSPENIRRMKVDAITQAREYLEKMVADRGPE